MSENHQLAEVIDHKAARRNSRLVAGVVFGILVIGAVIGLVVGPLRPAHGAHHHDPLVAVLVLIGVLVVVLGIAVPVTLRLYRRPNYARVMQYGWGQRRRVGSALRRGRPVAPEDRPVADAIVATMRQQRWLPYLFGVILVIYAVRAVFDHGFQRWLSIGLIVLYIGLLPWMFWERRRTMRNYDRLDRAGG